MGTAVVVGVLALGALAALVFGGGKKSASAAPAPAADAPSTSLTGQGSGISAPPGNRPPTPGLATYQVKSGDTFGKLGPIVTPWLSIKASDYYNGGRAALVWQSVNPALRDMNKIRTGQILNIPPRPAATAVG